MALPSILRRCTLAVVATVLACSAFAGPEAIREAISKRLPDLPPIDEIRETPIRGLFELRMGTDIFYTDERGNYLLTGEIIDTKVRTNLTRARIDKLTAVDFASLPVQDAIVWVQGNGERKLAVFADPNCTYCKKFERDLMQVKDVTVYTFLYPILGGDSPEKSRDIWCAKDNLKAWRDWMIGGAAPPRAMGKCDVAALERNKAFGTKHKVTGTPALVFEDGVRVPGAMTTAQIEKQLAASRKGG